MPPWSAFTSKYSILKPRSFIQANIALLPTRDGVAPGKFLLDVRQQWNARVKNFQELNIFIEQFTCSLTSSEAVAMLSPMVITLCNIYISICNIRQDKNRGLLRIVLQACLWGFWMLSRARDGAILSGTQELWSGR